MISLELERIEPKKQLLTEHKMRPYGSMRLVVSVRGGVALVRWAGELPETSVVVPEGGVVTLTVTSF